MEGLEALRQAYPWPNEKPSVPAHDHGWFGDGNAELLSRHLSDNTKLVLELGAWLGRSTRFFISKVPAVNVISVDTWAGSLEHQGRVLKQMLPTLYETFLVNCWEQRERITQLRMKSTEGMRVVHAAGLKPDLIYIDASHEYQDVFDDVTMACELFPEAQIVGDDWCWRNKNCCNHPTVRAAVLRYAVEKQRELSVKGGAWTFVKKT